MKLLLTGHTGFLGSEIYKSLKDSFEINLLTRHPIKSKNCFNLNNEKDIYESLKGVSAVIHCAAKNVDKQDNNKKSFEASKRFNVNFTKKLARYAESSGVNKFIFVSTAKVYGEFSFKGAFNENDTLDPIGNYAMSKALAENSLKSFCKKRKMKYVILRPPIILGKNSKGNLSMLKSLSRLSLPLPLGQFNKHKRSIIFIDTLVKIIELCITDDRASNAVFNVAEHENYSFLNLVKIFAELNGTKSIHFSIPMVIIRLLSYFLGKKSLIDKMYYPFELDTSYVKDKLRWKPKNNTHELFKDLI